MTVQEKERIMELVSSYTPLEKEFKFIEEEEQKFIDNCRFDITWQFDALNERNQHEILEELVKSFKGNKVELLRKLTNTIHL